MPFPKHPKLEVVRIPDARMLVLDDQPKRADDAIAMFVEQVRKEPRPSRSTWRSKVRTGSSSDLVASFGLKPDEVSQYVMVHVENVDKHFEHARTGTGSV